MQFDSMYVPNEAIRRHNNQIKKAVLSGQIAEAPDINGLQGQVKQELSSTGNQRFIKPDELDNKTWKEVLKDKDSQEFQITKWRVDVSAGFYIRQLVSDIGKYFGFETKHGIFNN